MTKPFSIILLLFLPILVWGQEAAKVKTVTIQTDKPALVWKKYGMILPNDSILQKIASQMGFEYNGSVGCLPSTQLIDSIEKIILYSTLREATTSMQPRCSVIHSS